MYSPRTIPTTDAVEKAQIFTLAAASHKQVPMVRISSLGGDGAAATCDENIVMLLQCSYSCGLDCFSGHVGMAHNSRKIN